MTAMTRGFAPVSKDYRGSTVRVVSSIILEVTLNGRELEKKHTDSDRPHVNKKTAEFCLMISFQVCPTLRTSFSRF